MNDNLNINQDAFNHFLIEKLIELKAENNLHKHIINAILLKSDEIITITN